SGAKNILYVLIITVTLEVMIGFTIVIFVAQKMSEPIEKLADQAIKISNGELEMNDIEIEGNDEIAYLTMAFNQMIHDIKKLIKEIKDKATLKALLKETELKALQSQVNPHFLFNILSVITESALIEGADKTLSMVEKISGMLRYSLTSFHKEVKLEDELEMVKRYVYLQSQRFGDRIKFEIDLPENIPLIYMTCMTIQPIVENAIIHGLEQKIQGGTIKISLKEEKKYIIIQIQDDGIGIDKEVLDKLFDENNQKNHTGHTTGIGINNVYERLKIYFEQENLLLIDSEINAGTCVTILLPRTNKRGGK
ncbi:MAG: histidine kinase, partial [Clostridiaceae bacterium]